MEILFIDGMLKGGNTFLRSDFADVMIFQAVLDGLTYPNYLVMRICLKTGLRLDDVLSIKKDILKLRFTVHEKKTGKSKRVYLGVDLFKELDAWCKHNPRNAGCVYVFPHRLHKDRHRTRQAVYKDVKNVARRLALTGNICPHSARKCAAVREFNRTRSLSAVKRFLNHDSDITTMLYALSDKLRY